MDKVKNFVRNNLLCAVIGGLIFGATGVIADTVVDSGDVSHNDTTDVQTAIDNLYRIANLHVEDIKSEVKNEIYPVGSIYMSASPTDPSALFGGTWTRFGKGKAVVGVDETDDDFKTPEKSGGSKTKAIAVENLPSHAHTYTPAGTIGNTGGGGSHTHGVSNTSTTRTSNANNRGHTHSGSTSSNGNHTHVVKRSNSKYGVWGSQGESTGTRALVEDNKQIYGSSLIADTAGIHNHTFTTGGESQNHTHTYTDYYANTTSGGHTLTVAEMPSHNHSFTGTASSTTGCTNCNGAALNTQDPYITVYMWKRIA